MVVCAACRSENAGGQRFCGSCGASLARPSATPAEERKVVTALFCDLVGFTAASESADPEDIDRMLTAYFAVARSQIEAHGGVVEKFIGDAVLGVFGVPTAHEDDPERAVRAALAIADEADQLDGLAGAPVRLRVGINTGEALVRLGVDPGSGERFLAGDAINTASRIQSAAPEMGVAVGQRTFEATRALFAYQELEPATLKGKAEPVRVFHARAALARATAGLERPVGTQYVGRTIDLALLKGLYDKARSTGSVQLVTIVGEPGIGKSRIVGELHAYARAGAARVTWRVGRCLPYGEGITFWALSEVLKAHAGISDSDGQDAAGQKLDDILPDGPERTWFRQRLAPLVGIDGGGAAERDEQFTAWRRFLEYVAEQRPTVLVFEDIHWADEALLDFLEHLADRAEAVPLSIVGTARPELYERHPGFASRLHNANRINLAPLSTDEVEDLVTSLLAASGVSSEVSGRILERAEGNPLYAEELVRLVADRQEHGDPPASASQTEVAFPHSVQALIAARLDTLSPERKSLLADAAVVGKVFWANAVAAMGERDVVDVIESLRELTRKELVRPIRKSSIAGEAEYAFSHILTRDVAYAQLPRPARAHRHAAAARWIESVASDRLEDLADVLAYHYETGLAAARAGGLASQAAELEAPALRFLTLAGERALGLDTNAAVNTLTRALAITSPGDPRRAKTLALYGQAAIQAGRFADGAAALEEAIPAFRADGDIPAAAQAMTVLARLLDRFDDARASALELEALALVETLGPSPHLVRGLTDVAGFSTTNGQSQTGLDFAERALALAEELGLPRPARALGFRGMARIGLGDAGGVQDLREAIGIATTAGEGREVAILHLNLGFSLLYLQGPAASLEELRAGRAYAEARGIAEVADFIGALMMPTLVDLGAFDEALAMAERLVPTLDASGDYANLLDVRRNQARIAALRGRVELTAPWLDDLVGVAHDHPDPGLIALSATVVILVRLAAGEEELARTLLSELEPMLANRQTFLYPTYLPAMVRAALQLGEVLLAERLADWQEREAAAPYEAYSVAGARAAISEARHELAIAADEYGAAAETWHAFGVVPEEAFALLGRGRCLIALGREAEAMLPLEAARAIFVRLEAGPALAETEALLARVAVT